MTRRLPFWVVLVALGLGGLVTAVRLLPEALDLVRDEIAMDRAEALLAAERLAELYDLRPASAPGDRRSAASYGEKNPGARSFVELEQGGSEAFEALVESGAYVPSRWTVRLFAPDSVAESRIELTPAGWPLGFGVTLSDEDPGGGNLEPAAAEALARATATEWGVDLADFDLVESSSDEVPSGRIDHAFTFRRRGVDLGEGEVRLRVDIAGSRPSGVDHFIEVPESFQLRYQEIRTGNDGIALAASALFLVLFVGVAGGGGVLALARDGWLEVRPALALGAVVGFGLTLNGLNTIPLAWMAYDTSLSESGFVAQLVGSAVLIGVVAAPFLGAVYMAAESMGRRAFPGHIQQWRFWSRDVARSDTALGLTLAGYVIAGLHLGYVTLFSLATSRLEGWWSPPSNVIQPDLIATVQPWVLAVATNLFAATWEESVFRAMPLAGAALLGARFGRRGLWVGAALVLQAVVFAAGHANYPQQPAYARVVELLGPALIWGAVYLRFGLVPTIFAHFLYNLYLSSIPLFQMSSPGIWIDRGALLAVASVPLLVVLGARLRHGARAEAPAEARNGAWVPPARATAPAADPAPLPEPAEAERPGAPPLHLPVPGGALLPLGVGLMVAAWVVAPGSSLPPASATRADAVAAAEAELRARGFDLEPWRVLADFTSGTGGGAQWVFEEHGAEVYDGLLGLWISSPHWEVRFVDFQAPAEERAEEFTVSVGGDGAVTGFRHTLPEGREGPSLDEAGARALALEALVQGGHDPAAFDEVAADQSARPSRLDWTFGFRARDVLPDSLGEARVDITVSGDEVTAVRRGIQAPEAWVREQAALLNRVLALAVPVVLLVLAGGSFLIVAGVRLWTRRELHLPTLGAVAGVASVLLATLFLNGLPEATAGFAPALGWSIQIGGLAFAGVFFVTAGAGALGLTSAVARAWLPRQAWRAYPTGLGVAATGAALLVAAVVARFLPDPSPPTRVFEGIDYAIPLLAPLAGGLLELVGGAVVLAFMGAFYRRAGTSSRMRTAFEAGVALVAGSVLAVGWSEGEVSAIVAAGLVAMGIHVYGWLYANHPRIAVEAAGAGALASLVGTAIDPSYPGQAAGAAVGAALVVAATVLVWRRIAGSE